MLCRFYEKQQSGVSVLFAPLWEEQFGVRIDDGTHRTDAVSSVSLVQLMCPIDYRRKITCKFATANTATLLPLVKAAFLGTQAAKSKLMQERSQRFEDVNCASAANSQPISFIFSSLDWLQRCEPHNAF